MGELEALFVGFLTDVIQIIQSFYIEFVNNRGFTFY